MPTADIVTEPHDLARLVKTWVLGVAERHRSQQAGGNPADRRPPIVMLSGAQGIGKSTAMQQLCSSTTTRIAILGLDDAYHTRATRAALAASRHRLCATRGPPGSHDLALLRQTLSRLMNATSDEQTALPRFDKVADDRAARTSWPVFQGRPDVVVIEGWCLGVLPRPETETTAPINLLELEHDPKGVWRDWQEAALVEDYLPLWHQADAWLHLLAPDFAVVEHWRTEQECTTLGVSLQGLPAERRSWVNGFIQHYERLTRRMLAGHRWPGEHIVLNEARKIVTSSLPLR